MPSPETEQAVAIARLDTKVDTLFKILGDHKRDLEQLKSKRLPGGFLSAGFSAVAAVATVYMAVHK